MFVYRIILEPVFPLDIWNFKDSPVINIDDAHFIWETFPFEEPEVFEEEPELGPPPHILFGNLLNNHLLVLSYRGKGEFDATLSESKGAYWRRESLDRSNIRRMLDTFWETNGSTRRLRREFLDHQGFLDRLFRLLGLNGNDHS